MRRRVPRLCLLPAGLLAAAALLGAAPAARAVWFAAAPLDAVDADAALALDLGQDGTGGVAYRKGGHVWVSALAGGAFGAPVRVDPGLPAGAGRPALAAAGDGALAVGWVTGGRLYAAYRPPGSVRFPAPTPLFAGAGDPTLDLSIHDKGYLAFTAGGDVRLARLRFGAWALLGAPLDAVPARAVTAPPRVTAAGDGTAIVVWGEAGHVYVRRVRDLAPSVRVAQVDVPSYGGHGGGTADQPDVAAGYDDSRALLAWRQRFADGRGGAVDRVLARTLRGGVLDPPVAEDGLGPAATEGAGAPRVAAGGDGGGVVVLSRETSRQVWAAPARSEARLGPGVALDAAPGAAGPLTVPARADGRPYAYVAWTRGGDVRVRAAVGGLWAPAAVISNPGLGPIDARPASGLQAAADAAGDLAVAFVQGTGTGRRLAVGGLDLPPTAPSELGPAGWQRSARPRLTWTPSSEAWGALYTVLIDGRPAAVTATARARPPARLSDGRHAWRVVARDRRGQAAAGAPARLRIDTRRPRAALSVRGDRTPGRRLALTVRAADPPPKGGPASARSGVRAIAVAFGDGGRARGRRGRFGHAYRRPGRYVVAVRVVDRAGNATRLRRVLRIAGGGGGR